MYKQQSKFYRDHAKGRGVFDEGAKPEKKQPEPKPTLKPVLVKKK